MMKDGSFVLPGIGTNNAQNRVGLCAQMRLYTYSGRLGLARNRFLQGFGRLRPLAGAAAGMAGMVYLRRIGF